MSLGQNTKSNCPSCGAIIEVNFCSHCGEKKMDASLRSFKHIIMDGAEDLTSINGKLWRSVGMLCLRPGSYDYNYHVGRRVKYYKPVSLFLIINIIFIIFSPLTDFYVNLDDQLNLQPYSALINEPFLEYLNKAGITINDFNIKYDQAVKVLSRSLIILEVPIFMIFVSFLFYKKDFFLSDHFIFALNTHAWLMVWSVVLINILKTVEMLLGVANISFVAFKFYYPLFPIGLIFYMLFAAKKLYQFSWLRTVLTTIVLLSSLSISHLAYRFIQFLITVYIVS